jgi:hypothetical protein
MKLKFCILALGILGMHSAMFAQKKIGIINFSFEGKDRMASVGSMDNSGPSELCFIGSNSTRLNDTTRTSDEILRYTESALKEFFATEMTPVNLNRSSAIPDEMNGSLWIMETITEKAAFNKFSYDEAITINARIYSGGSMGSSYTPVIEISVVVINKEGKKVWKKSEKLRLKGVKIEKRLVELEQGNSGLSFSDIRKVIKGSTEKTGSESGSGVPAVQLLDWYKQCLTNLLLSK